jgi:hypothetical protein
VTLAELVKVVGESTYRRLNRLLEPIQDPELLILKGHLLVEEQLEKILAAVMMQPERLREARLSFHQKLKLSRAIAGYDPTDPDDYDLLSGIEHLNVLRNSLAHDAEPDELDERIERFIVSYCGNDYKEDPKLRDAVSALKHIFSCMCTGAEAVADCWREHMQRGFRDADSAIDNEEEC